MRNLLYFSLLISFSSFSVDEDLRLTICYEDRLSESDFDFNDKCLSVEVMATMMLVEI